VWHVDGLKVAAEGLTHGDGAGQPAGRPQPGHRAGERHGQGTAVSHHINGPDLRVGVAQSRQDGRHGRVQVGQDDGHRVDPRGVAQHLVMRAFLLVDAEDHRLHGRVSRLDDVPGAGLRVGW